MEPPPPPDVALLLSAIRAAGERFLWVVGPGISDPAAIPLPFVTNTSSPSLLAIASRALDRRCGAGFAARLAGEGLSPRERLVRLLRAAAPDRAGLAALLGDLEEGKRPAVTHRALAGLARAGLVRRAVSSCHDHLLPWTLARHRVPHTIATTPPASWDAPGLTLLALGLDVTLAGPPGAPPATAPGGDRDGPALDLAPAFEAAAGGGGALVVGHSGIADAQVHALATLARAGRLPRGVFWLQDEDQHEGEGLALLRQAAASGARLHVLARPETSHLLDELVRAAGVPLAGPVPPYSSTTVREALAHLLDAKVDVRDALEVVPVVNLYEPLYRKLPPVRVRTAIVLALALAGLVGGWNLLEVRWREGELALERARLEALSARLETAASFEAAREVDRDVAALRGDLAGRGERLLQSVATIEPLRALTADGFAALAGEAAAFADERVAPALARLGLVRELAFDERFNRFNRFPDPVLTLPGGDRIGFGAALDRHAVLLTGASELALEVLAKRAALRRAQDRGGPLPVVLDLQSAPGAGPADAPRLVARAVSRWADLPEEVAAALLEQGAAHLIVLRAGRASNLARNLFDLERTCAAFPRLRVLVVAPGLTARDPVAPSFAVLRAGQLGPAAVLDYAASISTALGAGLAARRDLLRAARDPLFLSVIVDHFQSGGTLPSSRGLLLDAFVTEYLEQQVRSGVASGAGVRAAAMKRILAELVDQMAQPWRAGAPLTRAEALRHAARALDRDELYGLVQGRAPVALEVLRSLPYEAGGPSVPALARGERAIDAAIATGLLQHDPVTDEVRFGTDELQAYFGAFFLRMSTTDWYELECDDACTVPLYAELAADPARIFLAAGSVWQVTPTQLPRLQAAADMLGHVAEPHAGLERAVLQAADGLLGHGFAFRRRQGLDLLLRLATPAAVRRLLEVARDPDEARALAALGVLAELAPSSAVAELRELLRDGQRGAGVRAGAAGALARTGQVEAEAALRAVVEDAAQPEALRVRCAAALLAAEAAAPGPSGAPGGAPGGAQGGTQGGAQGAPSGARSGAPGGAPGGGVQGGSLGGSPGGAQGGAQAAPSGAPGGAQGGAQGSAGRDLVLARIEAGEAAFLPLARDLADPGEPRARAALVRLVREGRDDADREAAARLLARAGARAELEGLLQPDPVVGSFAALALCAGATDGAAADGAGVVPQAAATLAALRLVGAPGGVAPPPGHASGLRRVVAALAARGEPGLGALAAHLDHEAIASALSAASLAPEATEALAVLAEAAARHRDGLRVVLDRLRAGAVADPAALRALLGAACAAAPGEALELLEAWERDGRLGGEPVRGAAVVALRACRGGPQAGPWRARARRLATRLLQSAAPVVRGELLVTLAALWAQDADPAPLLAALAGDDPTRARVAETLGAVTDPRLLAGLTRLVRDLGVPDAAVPRDATGQVQPVDLAQAQLEPTLAAIKAIATGGDLGAVATLFPVLQRVSAAVGADPAQAARLRPLLLALGAAGRDQVAARPRDVRVVTRDRLLDPSGSYWADVLAPFSVPGPAVDDELGSFACEAITVLAPSRMESTGP